MSIDWAAFLSAWEASAGSEARRQPPATDEAIAAAEARLGVALPTDYAALCRVSNGWADPKNHPVYAIRPLERIGWYPQESPESFKIWSRSFKTKLTDAAYLNYASHAEDSTPSHLKHALLLAGGEEGDEVDAGDLVLNPQVIHGDGAWEAILITSWTPGATRSRDFTSLMIEQAANLFNVRPFREAHRVGWDPRATRFFSGSIGSARRKGRLADIPDADALLATARDGKFREKMRAIKSMCASDDPRVSAFLRETLATAEDERFRNAAVKAMVPRGDPESVQLLAEAAWARGAASNFAAAALCNIPGGAGITALRGGLERDPESFRFAASTLILAKDSDAMQRVLEVALREPDGGASASGFETSFEHAWYAIGLSDELMKRAIEQGLRSTRPIVRLKAARQQVYLLEAANDPAFRERAFAELVEAAAGCPNPPPDLEDAERIARQWHESRDREMERVKRLVAEEHADA